MSCYIEIQYCHFTEQLTQKQTNTKYDRHRQRISVPQRVQTLHTHEMRTQPWHNLPTASRI